jgi:predicted metal-dependent enzyme (double-stranded beta helix superfamily)
MTMPVSPPNLSRLRDFVVGFSRLIEHESGEAELLESGRSLLGALVAQDDWLPDTHAVPDVLSYRQYLLHCDGLSRFSVVAFVWGPGQATPVHDHTVWGLIGMLRGAEISQAYVLDDAGLRPKGEARRIEPGEIEAVSPTIGDIHRVANAYADRTSISIHVYGDDIGAVRRSVYDEAGNARPFVSSYTDAGLPNIWGARSGAGVLQLKPSP